MRQRTDADGKSEVSRVLDTVSQKRAGQNKPKQVIQAIQQLDIETTSLSTRTASKFPCVFLDLDRDAKKSVYFKNFVILTSIRSRSFGHDALPSCLPPTPDLFSCSISSSL